MFDAKEMFSLLLKVSLLCMLSWLFDALLSLQPLRIVYALLVLLLLLVSKTLTTWMLKTFHFGMFQLLLLTEVYYSLLVALFFLSCEYQLVALNGLFEKHPEFFGTSYGHLLLRRLAAVSLRATTGVKLTGVLKTALAGMIEPSNFPRTSRMSPHRMMQNGSRPFRILIERLKCFGKLLAVRQHGPFTYKDATFIKNVVHPYQCSKIFMGERFGHLTIFGVVPDDVQLPRNKLKFYVLEFFFKDEEGKDLIVFIPWRICVQSPDCSVSIRFITTASKEFLSKEKVLARIKAIKAGGKKQNTGVLVEPERLERELEKERQ